MNILNVFRFYHMLGCWLTLQLTAYDVTLTEMRAVITDVAKDGRVSFHIPPVDDDLDVTSPLRRIAVPTHVTFDFADFDEDSFDPDDPSETKLFLDISLSHRLGVFFVHTPDRFALPLEPEEVAAAPTPKKIAAKKSSAVKTKKAA